MNRGIIEIAISVLMAIMFVVSAIAGAVIIAAPDGFCDRKHEFLLKPGIKLGCYLKETWQ